MKKKWLCAVAVVLLLLVGGKIAFDKGKDYITKKMVTELANTEEVKKYKEEAEKAAEAVSGESEAEDTKKKNCMSFLKCSKRLRKKAIKKTEPKTAKLHLYTTKKAITWCRKKQHTKWWSFSEIMRSTL